MPNPHIPAAATGLPIETLSRRALVAGLPALVMAALPAALDAAPAPDPMVALVARWGRARAHWRAAAAADLDGNFETRACKFWERQEYAIQALIEATPIRTVEGLGALCHFLFAGNNNFENDPWPDVPRWALVKVRAWAASQIGGAA
ncbi:hypothetical protein BVG79_00165 [Ketogulonicigenium robustum]|uniref:Uncharacterized protein n=1 Tax=Ketogulonicigenium robustum TaxID=92947 RepID=A0A1W6NWC8_9RHOB|nr:hypothetical protein [Ketogulonicigenium robustum]ARO13525.1 hypothetical protein BVG79_00165 [Ketogulonicigenium robustum]